MSGSSGFDIFTVGTEGGGNGGTICEMVAIGAIISSPILESIRMLPKETVICWSVRWGPCAYIQMFFDSVTKGAIVVCDWLQLRLSVLQG